jgi:hypothetical protein
VKGLCDVGCHGVEIFRVICVNVRVVREEFPFGVSGDVGELVLKVVCVTDAMFVIAGVPDVARELLADGKGEAAFDQLDGFCGGFGWSDEYVNVIGHDYEAVKQEAALFAIAEERGDHELGVRGALKDSTTLVSDDGDGVGLWL